MKIDIVCPVHRDFFIFKELYNSFASQKNVVINKVCCALTLSNDKSDDEFREFFKDNKIEYFEVNKEDFSHSLIREKLIREYCESNIVVMISQDIKLMNEYVFYNLAKSIETKETVYNYARQIANNKSIEKYIREKNYPNNSFVVSKDDLEKMQIMALFASDACSCYNREIFIKLGGYQGINVQMNEDQLYSKIILEAGYKKGYVATAIVEHYHKYKLKDLYHRYFLAGQFYQKMNWNYKSTNSGFKLAMYVLKRSFQDFNLKALLFFIPDMSARYLGMKKGKRKKIL